MYLSSTCAIDLWMFNIFDKTRKLNGDTLRWRLHFFEFLFSLLQGDRCVSTSSNGPEKTAQQTKRFARLFGRLERSHSNSLTSVPLRTWPDKTTSDSKTAAFLRHSSTAPLTTPRCIETNVWRIYIEKDNKVTNRIRMQQLFQFMATTSLL